MISPKRNLDAESRVKEELRAQERNATVKRVRTRFDNFERVPEATAWLDTFREERDRCAFLIVRLGFEEQNRRMPLFDHLLQLDIGNRALPFAKGAPR